MSKMEDRIVELVEEHWAQTQAPLLLSRLGAKLRSEFDAAVMDRELLGGKLRPYVEKRLAAEAGQNSKLRLLHDPNNRIVWGLVPKSVTEPAAQLFERVVEGNRRVKAERIESTLQPGEQVRYDPALWSAFSTPNLEGRYAIRLADEIVVRKISEDDSLPDGFLFLPREDIPVSATPRERFFLISSRIERWADANSVDISRFKRTTIVGRVHNKSLLDYVLETIGEADLARISLPLHVVRALAAKKI